MQRSVISTPSAPPAIGPYSQAISVAVGDRTMIFTSGQIPMDPATGAMIDGDVGAQTRRVLDNLEAVLAAAGAGWGDVVKTTIFLADMADFGAVNELYAQRFAAAPPARSTVQAARLPRDARVEIEAVAIR
ncbi:MAG: RidA family protein [Kofleriaceae bacterium]